MRPSLREYRRQRGAQGLIYLNGTPWGWLMSSSAEMTHHQGNLLILDLVPWVCVTRSGFSTWCSVRATVLCPYSNQRGFISYPWGKNNHLFLTLMLRYWLPGFRNEYLIFKDHFVAGGRWPSQVFSTIWFNKLCWRNVCIIKFKSQSQHHWRTCPSNHSSCTKFCFLLWGSSPSCRDSESWGLGRHLSVYFLMAVFSLKKKCF